MLINKGANANQMNHLGETPFHQACQKGHLEVVRNLIKSGAADLGAADKGGRSPLYMACKNNHLEVAMLLIEKGADANVAANSGETPFHVACRIGQLSVVKLLSDTAEGNYNDDDHADTKAPTGEEAKRTGRKRDKNGILIRT
jgi:serine/threonine-protein phosphatase 6 regulatory ankyrin repeat subunit B